jgi:hypothetical protein
VEIPDEFKRFTRCFLQGSDEEATDERDWIARALKLNTPQQRAVVKRFLSELLNSSADDEELERVWNSGSPSYGIQRDHIRSFLNMIREMID